MTKRTTKPKKVTRKPRLKPLRAVDNHPKSALVKCKQTKGGKKKQVSYNGKYVAGAHKTILRCLCPQYDYDKSMKDGKVDPSFPLPKPTHTIPYEPGEIAWSRQFPNTKSKGVSLGNQLTDIISIQTKYNVSDLSVFLHTPVRKKYILDTYGLRSSHHYKNNTEAIKRINNASNNMTLRKERRAFLRFLIKHQLEMVAAEVEIVTSNVAGKEIIGTRVDVVLRWKRPSDGEWLYIPVELKLGYDNYLFQTTGHKMMAPLHTLYDTPFNQAQAQALIGYIGYKQTYTDRAAFVRFPWVIVLDREGLKKWELIPLLKDSATIMKLLQVLN
jgi:hypothetical protein